MRLTNYIRDAFVNAAMQDVPSTDYQEQANKIARTEVKRMFDSAFPNVDVNKVTDWIQGGTIAMPGALYDMHVTTRTSYYMLREKSPKVWEKLNEISVKLKEQSDARDVLSRKIRGAASACNTTKQLREMLPEFEKYLPEEEAVGPRTLPVVANIVADFTKAGWPAKGKK